MLPFLKASNAFDPILRRMIGRGPATTPFLQSWAAKPQGRQPFKILAYRGISADTPVDQGFWGKGTYFTTNPIYAKQYAGRYGRVITQQLTLENPFFARQMMDVSVLGLSRYQAAKAAGLGERAAADLAAREIRTVLEARGYDSIVLDMAPPHKEIVVFRQDPNWGIRPWLP